MDEDGLYTSLAVAGAIPFVACALLPLVGIEAIEPIGRLDEVAASYGLAIVSFMAGTHWATFLFRKAEAPFNLLVSSNVVVLAAWFAYLLPNIKWGLFTQLLAFLLLLSVDYRLVQTATISQDYFRARTIATALATVSLAIILVS